MNRYIMNPYIINLYIMNLFIINLHVSILAQGVELHKVIQTYPQILDKAVKACQSVNHGLLQNSTVCMIIKYYRAKSFIMLAPGANVIKLFAAISYKFL